jgi:hypothetical protein
MTKAPFNDGVTFNWFEPAYMVGFFSFLALSPSAGLADQPGQSSPSSPLFGCIPGELVAALLVALLPIFFRAIATHLRTHIRDTQSSLRKVLSPYLEMAVWFISLALLILASYVWPVGLRGNGSDPLVDSKRKLAAIFNEATQVFDQAKNQITPESQSAIVEPYLESVASRIQKVSLESAETPTTLRPAVKSQYFSLVALFLAVAGALYTVIIYRKQKEELKKFAGPEVHQCENTDLEKIRAKLESLDNQVRFALLPRRSKSRKGKD